MFVDAAVYLGVEGRLSGPIRRSTRVSSRGRRRHRAFCEQAGFSGALSRSSPIPLKRLAGRIVRAVTKVIVMCPLLP